MAKTIRRIARVLAVTMCYLHVATCMILRIPCTTDANFNVFESGKRLKGHAISRLSETSDIQCTMSCVKHDKCRSYNINRANMICELNSKALVDDGTELIDDDGWTYKSTNYSNVWVGPVCKELRPCSDGVLCRDKCTPPYYKCAGCDGKDTGLRCLSPKVTNRCQSNPCPFVGQCVEEGGGYYCKKLTNVALFKSANQSSTWKDHSALKAVDNKKLAKFGQGSCCHTKNEQNPWWNVDLGASYNIVGVELTNRGDCCEERLQMFEVTVDEQLCFYHHEIVPQGTTEKYACSTTLRGRIVKIQTFIRNSFHLCEVEVFTIDEVPGENHCLSSPCQNGGFCITSREGYSCRCATGFTGSKCETIDEAPVEE